jgi:hypothetical protein
MNRTRNYTNQSPRLRGAAMFGLIAALFCAAPAYADVVNFESLAASANESGITLSESGYNMLLVEGPVAAELGLVGGIGTIIDSSNPFSCDILACPAGASGNYLAVVNDGGVKFSHPGQLSGFSLTGFDFAFLPPAPVGPGNYGQLQLSGVNWQGTTITTRLDFPGQNANGSFLFGSAELDAAFRANVFSSLTISACIFDGEGECQNSFEHPAFNQAQFALDNLTLNAVPEPASFLLAALGLGALGLSRRRKKAAPSISL